MPSRRLGAAVAVAAAVLGFSTAQALANGHTMPIYSYGAATANYCPAGLQPVVIAGVICCGTPTTHQTWHGMMQHPTGQSGRTYSARAYDNPGVKGTGY